MSRKSVLITLATLLLSVGGLAGALALVLQHEPAFYREKMVAAGPQRKKQSDDFCRNVLDLFSAISNQAPNWQVAFTEAQINSYFDEELVRSGVADKHLPREVSAPRVAVEGDTIRLAFRYGEGPWSTVISAEVKPWLTRETNVVALELQGLRAGALPISAQSLLDQIGQVARKANIEVTWYRHNNNPVALLRIVSQSSRPTVQLRKLKVENGSMLLIVGSTQPGRPLTSNGDGQIPKSEGQPKSEVQPRL